VFLTHDWPARIAHYGDKAGLLRRKAFLAREIEDGSLGNPVGWDLMTRLRPRYWFSAHMHVKFAAVVPHVPLHAAGTGGGPLSAHGAPQLTTAPPAAGARDPMGGSAGISAGAGGFGTSLVYKAADPATRDEAELSLDDDDDGDVHVDDDGGGGGGVLQEAAPPTSVAAHTSTVPDGPAAVTRFLALDKCLPGRQYLQLLDVPLRDGQEWSPTGLTIDPEWAAVVRAAHRWTPATHRYAPFPPRCPDLSPAYIADTASLLSGAAAVAGVSGHRGRFPWSAIPFARTVPAYVPPFPGAEMQAGGGIRRGGAGGLRLSGNPQTDTLLSVLKLSHVFTIPAIVAGGEAGAAAAVEGEVGHTKWDVVAAPADGGTDTGGGAEVAPVVAKRAALVLPPPVHAPLVGVDVDSHGSGAGIAIASAPSGPPAPDLVQARASTLRVGSGGGDPSEIEIDL